MKNLSLVALSGAALLQVATAACCRNNNCLKAIAAQGVAGISDCSSNLAVTITPSAVTVTDTATVVESATETALFTETATEIASTETLFFTETTTITASTETKTIGEIITVPYTTTVFATAVPVTTTSYVYQTFAKARQVAETPLPEYATSCADWDMYVKACKCASVEPTTVTAEPATSTVTVPADNAVTTIVGTVSSTLTDTVYVTATTSVTATNAAMVVKTVTITETATESVASVVQATETPSVVVPLTCKPTGDGWRASNPLPQGTVAWMASTNGYTTVGWQTFPSVPALGSIAAQTSVWTVKNGFLEHRYNIASNSMVMVPYLETTTSEANAATVVVKLKSKSAVDAGVAAGTMERVRACVSTRNNQLLLTSRGRSNLLNCGNVLMLSTNTDGKDYLPDCQLLSPMVSAF